MIHVYLLQSLIGKINGDSELTFLGLLKSKFLVFFRIFRTELDLPPSYIIGIRHLYQSEFV